MKPIDVSIGGGDDANHVSERETSKVHQASSQRTVPSSYRCKRLKIRDLVVLLVVLKHRQSSPPSPQASRLPCRHLPSNHRPVSPNENLHPTVKQSTSIVPYALFLDFNFFEEPLGSSRSAPLLPRNSAAIFSVVACSSQKHVPLARALRV